MGPLEYYASVILHSGCAIPPKGEQESRNHKWAECRSQQWYMRVARKHQHKMQSGGYTIGIWIKKDNIDLINSYLEKND